MLNIYIIYHSHVEARSFVLEMTMSFRITRLGFPKIAIKSISFLAVKICLSDNDCILDKMSGFGRSIINWQLFFLKSFIVILRP